MTRSLPGLLAGAILVGVMVLSTAPVATLAWAGVRAGLSPWYLLPLSPVLYLGWLVTFLGVSAAICGSLGRRFPKPRLAVYTPGKPLVGPERGLVTVMVCYRLFAVLQTTPFLAVIAQLPYLNTLMFRAYAPAVRIPRTAMVIGRLQDPDLTDVGDEAVIGGNSAVVAHSMAFRSTGERVYVSAPVSIGDRTTIGGQSLVTLGCVIGADVIIEPGSVVEPFTKVPDAEVWGGNPARFRRTRDDGDASSPGITADSAREPTPSPQVRSEAGVQACTDVSTIVTGTPAASALDHEIRQLVFQALALRPGEVGTELSAATCARWDSLGQVAIAAALFDRYGIVVDGRDVFRLKTVEDIASLVRPQAAGAGPALPADGVAAATQHVTGGDRLGCAGVLPDDPEMLPLLDAQVATRALAASSGVRPGGRVPLRLHVAATFTAQAIEPTLRMWGQAFGLDIECEFAGYNQAVQALLDPGRPFVDSGAVGLVLARPEDFESESSAAEQAQADQLLEAIAQAARRGGGGRLLVGTLPPVVSSFALMPSDDVSALRERWRQRLHDVAGVELFDFARIVEHVGVETARASQAEVLMRAAYSNRLHQELAIALVRRLRAGRGSTAKVIALDCDNTLWGGVVGELGLDGILLGPDGPGRAFQLFQRRLKYLKSRGLLIAIVSKNEMADVRAVFEGHPGMVLSADDIAAWRVNWQPKSENLRELARELNLSLDAFVFVDDDAAMRLEVKTRVPSVHVVPMPEHASAYAETLERLWLFDGSAPTDVDAARTRMAQEERRRTQERGTAASLDEFLAHLDLEVDMQEAGDRDFPRVAQLTQRTNQFNLSLKRRSLEEVQAISSPAVVVVVAARDRFGDYGQVGVAILQPSPEPTAWEIDTLLMSCRALGRGIEDAFLHGITTSAAERGATRLIAPYAAGPRNAQVLDYLKRSGFEETRPDRWERSLEELPPLPRHVIFRRGGSAAPARSAVAEATLAQIQA